MNFKCNKGIGLHELYIHGRLFRSCIVVVHTTVIYVMLAWYAMKEYTVEDLQCK